MALIEREMIQDIVLKNTRADGRNFDEYRKITVEKGFIEKAEGSAKVTIGDTTVIAGIKMEPGTPYEDSADEGVLMVNAEFVPLASSNFEPGPPSEYAVELARVVDRMIRESKAVDMKKLYICEGKVWKLVIDIIVLDHDGNLIDAAALAASAALTNAMIPEHRMEGETVQVDYAVKGKEKVPLMKKTISVTVTKIANKLLLDLTEAEEKAMESRLTIGMFHENGKVLYCSMQKGGTTGFTQEDFEKAMDMAEQKSFELLKFVEQ